MLSNTIVKALEGSYIFNYRMKLCIVLFADGVNLPTEGYGYRGMEHALYLLDEMCRQEFEKANSNFKSQILNANISKYRKILRAAIGAHRAMINQTEYDKAFRQGMNNALSILDDFCDKEFEKAIKPPKKVKMNGGIKNDI